MTTEDEMRAAIAALVSASDDGADTYEVTDELEACAKAAGLPSKKERLEASLRAMWAEA